jgi:hypothetical protein
MKKIYVIELRYSKTFNTAKVNLNRYAGKGWQVYCFRREIINVI